MLKDKVSVITGASRGIGRAIALKMAENGSEVVIVYAGNREKAEETRTECEKFGVRAECYLCDVSDFNAVKELSQSVKQAFGRVDILVNNAGVTRDGLIAMMKEEAFDTVVDTNLKGAFNMIRNFTPMLLKSSGCIINMSSISGIMGNAGQSNYAASKAGLIGLTKSVAKELATKNVRCNAIAPGFIKTDMTESLKDSPLVEQIPLGRMGEAEDVAEACLYLTKAKYVTGVTLKIDGGLAM